VKPIYHHSGLSCPFYDKEILEVIYRPSCEAAKRSQSAVAGSRITWRRIGDARAAVHMASWLDKAQSMWERYATERSKRDFSRIIDRLDYSETLTQQHPKSRYVVLYNTSRTNLVSCVVSREFYQLLR